MSDESLLFVESSALEKKLGERETRPQVTLDDPFTSGKALTNTGTKQSATYTGEWVKGEDIRQGRGLLVI